MVKKIVRDVLFLGQKSEPATKQDFPVGQDLQDTLRANQDRCVGMALSNGRRMPVTGRRPEDNPVSKYRSGLF